MDVCKRREVGCSASRNIQPFYVQRPLIAMATDIVSRCPDITICNPFYVEDFTKSTPRRKRSFTARISPQ